MAIDIVGVLFDSKMVAEGKKVPTTEEELTEEFTGNWTYPDSYPTLRPAAPRNLGTEEVWRRSTASNPQLVLTPVQT